MTAAAGHRTATVTLQAVEAPIRPGVCATEENREYPPAFVDPGFVPVRKLEMSAPYMRLTPEKPYVLLHTRIYPMEATDRKLLWSITDASGIPSLWQNWRNWKTARASGSQASVMAVFR